MRPKKDLLKIDTESMERKICKFIKDVVSGSASRGLVLGLSGGVDSCVAAVLCTRAIQADNVLALLLPTSSTPKQDLEDARYLVEKTKIKSYEIWLDPIIDAFMKSLPSQKEERLPKANLTARCRMVCLYYYANLMNYLVVGTGDRSEILIGYFTKYGDGGADLLPLAHLYKTQVRQMASYLGLPENIVTKPSSPALWPGQKATDEIPVDYGVLDLILYYLFDAKLSPDEVAAELQTPRNIVDDVIRRNRATAHKRSYPPSMLSPFPSPSPMDLSSSL
ncbi:MAG: NAD+ synthase [Thermoproteota archaeon]